MKVRGRAWVLGDDINTDLLYPAACFRLPPEERRYLTLSATRPGWSREVRPGDVLVAGANFGIGSSRPAADNLKDLGIALVLADSFNGLFFRSAVNTGLPVLEVPGISRAVREGTEVEADLTEGQVRWADQTLQVRPLPPFLARILEDGGVLARLAKQGYID
jgi:3-isopropylmalate/(R)-2-methylmalate dehydratase small subunit